jgi:hypothetical protein
MADKRNKQSQVRKNSSEYYSSLRTKRGVKTIDHYATPTMKNPSLSDRRRIKTIPHIWAYGDRLYKLAGQYYGDTRYWWVIAWWNSYPTEADISTGAKLRIPLNLEEALDALGV